MSSSWMLFSEWWLRTALGGGFVLLVAWLCMRRDRQPARQQRIAEAGVATALLLAGLCWLPGWVNIPLLRTEPVALSQQSSDSEVVSEKSPDSPGDEFVQVNEHREPADWILAVHNGQPFEIIRDETVQPVHDQSAVGDNSTAARQPANPQAARQVGPVTASTSPVANLVQSSFDWRMTAFAVYFGFVGLFLARCVLGQVAIWRLKRNAFRPPRHAARLFRRMARGRAPHARLLVSRQVRVPISCGLVRPTVIIPAAFCAPKSRVHLDWVFAHELTHLERRDNWACMLYAIGQAVYFYVPCFWWLRRQARLCQEYVADAVAVQRSAAPDEYAEFLLRLIKSPRAPLGATAVSGNPSDLFRRVTMLLKSNDPVQRKCSLSWMLKAGAGFTALAVLLAGVGLRVHAGSQDPDPTEPAKKSARKAPPKPADGTAQAKPTPKRPPQDPNSPNPFQGHPELQEQMKRLNEEMKRFQEQFDKFDFQGGIPFDPNGQNFRFFQGNSPFQARGGGRLGLSLKQPDPALADQLELHKGNGLVVEKVDAGSAAEKAGFKAHDIVLEVKGQMVPSDIRELQKLVNDIKAGSPFDAVVLRKGQKQTIKGISLPEKGAEPAPQQDRFFGGGQNAFRGFDPNLPNIAPPLFQGQGGAFGFGQGGDGRSIMTSTTRTNDRFTTRHQEGSLIITITGKVDGNQSEVSQIQIQDGQAAAKKYQTVDEVPEQYRDKVKNLVEMNEKSKIKVEIRDKP